MSESERADILAWVKKTKETKWSVSRPFTKDQIQQAVKYIEQLLAIYEPTFRS